MNTEPPYTAQAIANTILDLAKDSDIDSITPMKMQKLIFFAHGWHLGLTDKPLISDTIQAWQYGPVIESLYHDLKQYGSEKIENQINSINFEQGIFSTEVQVVKSSDIIGLLKQIVEQYGKYSAIQLSNLTHEVGSPWYEVVKKYPNELSNRSIPIPNSLIDSHFKSLIPS